MANLPGTIEHLMEFKPEYISCTYGAGGGNVGANREVCQMIKKAGSIPVTHFTVIKNTKEGIREQLDQYLEEGVDHMLALRGDFPMGETSTMGDFDYATDLVKFVRDQYGDKFEIAVAGSPEGHISCRSLEADIAVLKQKPVSYTHLRAHETDSYLVCRLLLEKKKKNNNQKKNNIYNT